jgi:long-chain acyl-CoA synthetase
MNETELQSFWNFAARAPDALAVVEADGTEVKAGELAASANQIVHALRALSLQPGDCVGMMLPNCREVFEVFMAVAQAGWQVTPINWHLTAPEVEYILKDSGARAFFASERFADVAAAAASGAELPPATRISVGAIRGFRAWSDFKAGFPSTRPNERSAGGPMNYTSGTTGKPKGVRRPVARADADQVAHSQTQFLALFGIMPGDQGVHLVGSPTYHTAVLNFATNHLHLGHTVVLMDKWTPEGMLQLIESRLVTNSHMVPTQMTRLLKLPEEVRGRYDVSSLKHMIHSAAPCPVEIKKAMLAWWGPCIYEYYAASEGGGTLATPQDWLQKPGTVGKPWPISQIRILDDERQPLPARGIGTIWIRMGQYGFEYHGSKEKTEQAWSEGFFTVGDVGYLDEDGFLFMSDRKQDMIISGGVNIYPAEIEAVLVLHAKVRDVAVFGIPNDDWGEEVMAVVEPAAGVAHDAALEQELLEFASKHLAKYKLPRTVKLVASLPRDPNGKLYKRRLRDPYWQGRSAVI